MMAAKPESHDATEDPKHVKTQSDSNISLNIGGSAENSTNVHSERNLIEKKELQNTQNVGAMNLPSQYMPNHSSALDLSQQVNFLLAAQQPHNLIPLHLQANAIAASLNGTPGHKPALIPSAALVPKMLEAQQAAMIEKQVLSSSNQASLLTQQAASSLSMPPMPLVPPPALTVQDRPLVPPVFNGVNPNYPGLRLLHANPPVFAVDNFLSPMECQFLIHAAQDCFGPAPVVGKGAGEISPSRTSSTCYLAREDLPDYMRKVSMLTGKPIKDCELPQVGRYYPTQQYLHHFDAFDLSNEDGRRFASNGGQRTVTVLSYLNDVEQGGATAFPALNLQVQPRQGMAIVFFPATVDGLLDKLALHAAMPAVDTKYVSQVWIRQGEYSGQPSKRLPYTMGVPFSHPTAMTGYSGF